MKGTKGTSGSTDGIEEYLHKICLYNVAGVAVAMTGRLIEVEPSYVVFERKDGRRAKVKRSAITTIEEAR